MTNQRLNKLIKVSILAAMAFILMFIEPSLVIFPNFLKLDPSDVPALIGAFALGPIAGIAIELIKNVLHGLINGNSAFIGEMANFLVGSVYVFTAGIIYKRHKNIKYAIIGLSIGVVAMSLVAGILNYSVFLPLYAKLYNTDMNGLLKFISGGNAKLQDIKILIFTAIIPFNLIKGVVVSLVTMLLYKKVSPILHK